jgi:hypothetical protein
VGIKVLQHLPPQGVDAAVAFINEDDVEVLWNSGPTAARTGPIGIGHYSTEPTKLVTKSPVFSEILGESEKLPRCYHGHFSDWRQHIRATKKPLIPVA